MDFDYEYNTYECGCCGKLQPHIQHLEALFDKESAHGIESLTLFEEFAFNMVICLECFPKYCLLERFNGRV